MNQSIIKELENCFGAYEYFPFIERFDQFKSKKMYFLEGLNEKEIMNIYHHFIIFHYALSHKIYPKVSKQEIIEYYERRKEDGKP